MDSYENTFRRKTYSCIQHDKRISRTICLHSVKKQFCHTDDLRAHMKTHKGEKAYMSNQSNKRMCRGDINNIKEVQSQDINSQCYKQLSNAISIEHLRGENTYSCPQCQEQFSLGNNLHCHMIMHEEELFSSQSSKPVDNPFGCGLCGKLFSNKSSVLIHFRIHEEQP